jgi:uncharacterized membrane protein
MKQKPPAPVPKQNQAPAENGTREFKEIIAAQLRQLLPPDQVRKAADQLAPVMSQVVVKQTTMLTQHSGPTPPAAEVERLEAVLPGSYNRMLTMAEKDQNAFIVATNDAVRRDDRFRVICMASGLFALLIIIAGVIYLAVNGHENAAIALAGVGIAGVISSIVNARPSK